MHTAALPHERHHDVPRARATRRGTATGSTHPASRSTRSPSAPIGPVVRHTRGTAGLAARDAVAEASTPPAEASADAPATAPRPAPTGVALVVPAADDRSSWAGRARTLARLSRGRLAGASEAGMATAEYAIATVAAVGFAGLLVVVLRSGEVKGLLTGLIRGALSV